MKRVLGVILMCTLLMAGLTSFAGAEEAAPSLAITVDATSVENGDTVTATVTASNYKGTWSAMTVKVTYDPNYLSFDEKTGVISSGNSALEEMQTVVADVNKGIILINWISDEGVPAAEYLVKLQFIALAETTETTKAIISAEFTADGQAELGLEEPIVNTDGNAFSNATASTGGITVTPKAPSAGNETGSALEESLTIGGTADFIVNAKYEQAGRTIDTYRVVISWDDMEFVFGAGQKWNAENHKWYFTDGKWTGEGIITVANHSSQPVVATADYEALNENGTDMEFTGNGVKIDACGKGVAADAAPSKEIKAKVSVGEISNIESAQIGTIIVTIS